ncbi:MAG TPA: hypothetical protein VG737_07130, partial [Cyclobacteriaceae bacterium]|nr:hypothetical protein [Cyclobacteriaceae bacterium]
MKISRIAPFAVVVLTTAFAPAPKIIDLHKEVKNKNIAVFNRELSLIDEKAHPGIRLSKDEGEGLAWVKGVEFSEGIIEFDVRGENVKQHSFVGFAFHGKDNATFDAIYFRPFNFKEQNEAQRSHSIQYISLPDHPWRVLREKFPNKYEQAVNPAPDPDSWISVRLEIKGKNIAVFVNGSSEPSLAVEKVSSVTSGGVGFYVADTSGGDFAN